jgi:hypothetical protein
MAIQAGKEFTQLLQFEDVEIQFSKKEGSKMNIDEKITNILTDVIHADDKFMKKIEEETKAKLLKAIQKIDELKLAEFFESRLDSWIDEIEFCEIFNSAKVRRELNSIAIDFITNIKNNGFNNRKK